MKVSDRALNAMKARVESLMPAQEIRRIRKRLGLTQEEAGKIVGGGKKAFTKYESGDTLPSHAIANLLKLLDANPDSLSVLAPSLGCTANSVGGRKKRLADAAA
jgi:HTH-type transcriptional regulator / antitoxin MqsA